MNIPKLLHEYRIKPDPRRGEHFLLHKPTLQREVKEAEISPDEVVLEIGAGPGNLTKLLAAKAKKVIAIESNPKLCKILREQGFENVQILEGDALKLDFPSFDKVVSNLPYQLSSPITFKLLSHSWKLAILTYQEEFAKRFLAKPNSPNYSRLTVAINHYAEPEILQKIPRGAFWPSPAVDSVLVELKPKKPQFKADDFFWLVVKACFQHKGKLVRNALRNSAHLLPLSEKEIKEHESVVFKKRVRNCSAKDFKEIAEKLRG